MSEQTLEQVMAEADMARLEFEVCEAALKRREVEKKIFPLGAPRVEGGASSHILHRLFVQEQEACDALIAARKQVETQVLYQEKKS